MMILRRVWRIRGLEDSAVGGREFRVRRSCGYDVQLRERESQGVCSSSNWVDQGDGNVTGTLIREGR
jgi:hypothetical protein